MSVEVYSRLLAGFRQGWVDAGDKLFNLEIISPGHLRSGVPGVPDTWNRETHEAIATVSIPFDRKSEAVTDALAVMAKSDGQRQRWLPTQDEIHKFKRLSAEAGAALPITIRDTLAPYHVVMDRNAESWWISLLAFTHRFTVCDAEGNYQNSQVIENPWLESANAIESLKLNTESPCWPTDANRSTNGTDVGNSEPLRKKRGRPKADDKTIKSEQELVDKWERARDSGEYKPTFARDNDMTPEELETLLDRVAARKKRSDN